MDHTQLVAARDLLRTTLQKSTILGLSVAQTSHKLEEMGRRLPSLEADLRPFPNQLCMCLALGEHFNWAVRPTDAVLNAFESVRHLESSLLSSLGSAWMISTYISTVKSLEEALGFLTNSCTLAIQWLNGTVEFLQGNNGAVVARERYLENVNKCLCIIRELQAAEERSRLRGGTLDTAFNKLEDELKRFLAGQGAAPWPEPAVQKLKPVIERLTSNNRLEKCVSVFIEVRTRSASETFQALRSDYLDVEFEDHGLKKWSRHLIFAVKELFENEYLLCRKIFEPWGADTWTRCFAGIALGSGFCKLLEFGMRVAEGRKSPNKLLNLLDIFSTLDGLRPTFARLFGGDACGEIQDATRDLIKKVVDGCWEIFWELSYQVELQRQTAPPPDGGVPGLVSFVTDYCNQLLGDAYRPSMIQVLVIYQNWKRDKYQEGLFTNQIYNVVKQIGLNLDSWSKSYDDGALSYLFMMNNHSHLCGLRGTKLGDMMGESWLKAHEQHRDSCSLLYVKESWDKISAVGVTEQDMSFSDQRYLSAFNEVFQNMYHKHSQWSIPDEKLREKVLKSIVESIVPAYRSCLQRHGGDSWNVRVRSNNGHIGGIEFSVEAMEGMIESLFQPSPRKLGGGGSGNDYMTDKIVNVVANSRYKLTLTAA